MDTPLHQTWTYQALLHDLLKMVPDKFKVIENKTKPRSKFQIFDLNPSDKFWREHRGSPPASGRGSSERALQSQKARGLIIPFKYFFVQLFKDKLYIFSSDYVTSRHLTPTSSYDTSS